MPAHPHLPAGRRCIANVRRDFSEWHRGRPRYALWALDVSCAPVSARVAAAQRCLDGLLLAGYRRQPHVTLSLCGFPSAVPRHADEFGAAALAEQLQALRAARPAPFDIEIGTLSSFASAPFLHVHDDGGGIDALRAYLACGDLNRIDGDYLAHVTVGLYGAAWHARDVRARLDAFAPGAPLRVRIERISLFSYASADIGGPLARVADYDFVTGRLRCHESGINPGAAGEKPDACMGLQRLFDPR